jgi:hypothetical protein
MITMTMTFGIIGYQLSHWVGELFLLIIKPNHLFIFTTSFQEYLIIIFIPCNMIFLSSISYFYFRYLKKESNNN